MDISTEIAIRIITHKSLVSEEDWDMSDTITNMGSKGKRKGEEKSLYLFAFLLPLI